MCTVVALTAAAAVVHSCGIYSFTGTSIQPDVKTVTIPYFEYKALKVNPALSNQIKAMEEKYGEKFGVTITAAHSSEEAVKDAR